MTDDVRQELLVVRQQLAAAQQELLAAQQELVAAQQELHAAREAAAESENLALQTALAWRTRAVDAWAVSAAGGSAGGPPAPALLSGRTDELATELDAMRKTLSWRVTRPLRMVRGVTMKPGR